MKVAPTLLAPRLLSPRLLTTLLAAAVLALPAAAHIKMPKDPGPRLVERPAGAAAGVIYYTGYSHIDFNWLWDWPDTTRTWDSTARTALNLMYRFPDYNFGETQAAAYLAMERIRPEIFQDLKSRIAEGRWHILGGMWDESDTDLPSGEALARSFLLGQSYFQQTFGQQAKVGFLPDSFGHTRQLPQILKQAEIDYFYFQRCPRSKHLFWWKAPNGSQVLAYSSPGWYNDRVDPGQTNWPSTIMAESGVNIAMCVFGVGNHGGGPTISDLTTLDMLKTDPTFPEVREAGPEAFYEACLAQKQDFPVFDEELQYTFEGCYTSKSVIKKILREAENELQVAETMATLSSLYGGSYPADDLRAAWRHTTFNQFHDIAPGTAIHSTYIEAANKQKMLKQTTEKVIGSSWAVLEPHLDTSGEGRPLAVWNPLAWTRTDVVETTQPFDANPAYVRVTRPDGTAVPAQIVGRETRDGKTFVTFVFVAEDMPSLGYRVYHVAPSDADTPVADPVTVESNTITTPRFLITFDATTGQVSRLFDRTANRDVLPTGQRALRLQILGENANTDAWNLNYNGVSTFLDAPTSMQVLETGPVRARLQVQYAFNGSTFSQIVDMYRNLPRVDVRLDANFQGEDMMVKTVVPASVTTPTATFDVPFAAITRPTDGHEVPHQKWMDVGNGTYGLSVLNDCKYGADVSGSRMRLSLMRGSRNPDSFGDKGFQRIGYSLYPHAGDWKAAGTMRRGFEFNLPLRVMPVSAHTGDWGTERSFLGCTMPNVAVTALKRAEDGDGLVLRCYEFEGGTRSGGFSFTKDVDSAAPVNILEHPLPGSVFVGGNTFSFRTQPYTIHSFRVHLKP